MTLAVNAPHFCAGVWVMHGYVRKAAPIIRYTIGWTLPQLYTYADKKGWTITSRAEALRAKRKSASQCLKCGSKAVTKTLCLRHAIQARNQFKDKKGWYKPYKCASRLAE